MFFMTSPYYPGDFVIAGDGYLGIVRLRLSEKIRATLPEIEKEYFHSVAELALLPRGGPVACELWLYSRYGTLRFFRVMETGLEELDRSSILFREKKPEVTGKGAAGPGNPGLSGPAGVAGPGSPVAAPVNDVAGDPTGRIHRWLAKRNAAIKAGGCTNFLDPRVLDLLSGAEKPGPGTKPSAGKTPAGSPETPSPGGGKSSPTGNEGGT
jgi:hypothetical protein